MSEHRATIKWARDGADFSYCGVDLEAVADKAEPRIGWTITGAAWHQLSEAIASCC